MEKLLKLYGAFPFSILMLTRKITITPLILFHDESTEKAHFVPLIEVSTNEIIVADIQIGRWEQK